MRLVHRQLAALGGAALLALGAVAAWRHDADARHERAAATADAMRPFAGIAAADVRYVALTTPAGHFVMERRDADGRGAHDIAGGADRADGASHADGAGNGDGTDSANGAGGAGSADDASASGDAGMWALTAPRRLPAEDTAVDALVAAATNLTAQATLDAAVVDYPRFGLAPPRTTVALGRDAAHVRVLHVGRVSHFDGALYACTPGAASAWVLPSELAPALARDLYALRDKRPATLTAARITAIDVTVPDGPGYRLERAPGGAFLLARPQVAGADPGQVDAVLDALTGLRAQSFVREAADDAAARRPFGLARPSLSVTVTRAAPAAPVTLHFGEVRLGDAHPRVFVQRADRNAPVLALDQGWALSRLRVPAQALRDMRLVHAQVREVRAVTIRRGGAELRLELQGQDAHGLPRWAAAAPASAPPLAGHRVAALVRELVALRGDSVAHEHADLPTLRRAGLLPAAVEVDLEGMGGANLGGIRIGAADGAARLVTAAGSARIDRVAGTAALPISTRPEDYTEAREATPNEDHAAAHGGLPRAEDQAAARGRPPPADHAATEEGPRAEDQAAARGFPPAENHAAQG